MKTNSFLLTGQALFTGCLLADRFIVSLPDAAAIAICTAAVICIAAGFLKCRKENR